MCQSIVETRESLLAENKRLTDEIYRLESSNRGIKRLLEQREQQVLTLWKMYEGKKMRILRLKRGLGEMLVKYQTLKKGLGGIINVENNQRSKTA